jgi:Uncharacterised nucleotidyltransferase
MPQVSPGLRRVARVLMIDHVTAEIVTAMRAAGIRPLLLKGPSIASWLYRDGAHRAYDDSDILVAPGSYRLAGEVLRELGFRHHEYVWLHYVQTWRRGSELSGVQGGWPSVVDLHRSLNGVRASADAVWDVLSADTDTLPVGGVEVEILCVPARALHVALHTAQHGADVRRPLEDLERALRLADDHVWREARDLARQLDALPAFGAGLRLDPDGARLAERLRLPVGRPIAVALRVGAQEPVAIALESLASQGSRRDGALLLFRALAPSRLYMRDWSATRMARWPAALREGTLGLWLAYLWRPIWNLGRLPKAIIALRLARRAQAHGDEARRMVRSRRGRQPSGRSG